MPGPMRPISAGENASTEPTNARGYSDSAIPTYRGSIAKECQVRDVDRLSQHDHDGPLFEGIPRPSGQVQGVFSARQNELGSSLHVKARQNLKLPCFKTLGISSRLPEAPPTPPDEGIHDFRPVSPPVQIPRSSSSPPTSMPKTPSPEQTEFAVILGNDLSNTKAPSANHPSVIATQAEDVVTDQVTESIGSGSEHEDVDPTHTGWVIDAVDAAVASMDNDSSNSVNALCHSQPCPLPNDTGEAVATTAFGSMISGIWNKIQSNQRWVQVTHAVPTKFSMSQIPNSPITTPSVQNASTAAPDYFSLQTNMFSSAVVAVGHQEALNSSVPSSPHPIVCPASMNISLLERFIPPSSAEEYLGLFSTDGPSVLVDRLVELSTNGGSLLFIYPTATGANKFSNAYLGPLLHPLLRTMCSIHGLSMDFGAGVGTIGPVDQMYTFETMLRKIQLLLRKLSRGTSSINRQQPKFTLVESSKQLVELDRKTWTIWWTHQETPRMRTVVDRYLKRGIMMPTRIGGKDVTAATLVQEVLDGVKEGRNYTNDDPERKGIEVGVFVIKRTA